MSLTDTLEDARVLFKETMKKNKYKKANADRQAAVELQSSLAKCRGKLELCRKDFTRTIEQQSRNIAAGQQAGMDTMIQEQMLWDAALGYMLVNDAIYALKSIATYDSVAHAYDLLEAATKQMTGKKGALAKVPTVVTGKDRNAYGYVTSSAAVKDKEELLGSFFDKLKVTGDIDGCLSAARNPVDVQAEQRNAYTGGVSAAGLAQTDSMGSSLDAYMDRLGGVTDTVDIKENFAVLDGMTDIHPPKDL